MITEAHWETLSIKRMIFHVIGKSAQHPTLLDSIVPHEGYEEFFLDRVKDTLRGAAYVFNEIAGTREALHRASGTDRAFVQETKNLANRFQALYENDKRLSDGVLLVLELTADGDAFFDIIKLDHDPGVAYDLKQENGQLVAILASIQNQFSKRKEAMQKSALITLDRTVDSQVFAIDRSGRPDITAPFQSFLDVHRLLTNSEVTTRLCEAIYRVGMKHQNDLPPDMSKGLKHRTKEALKKVGRYDPENIEPLKAAVYGALNEEHPIHKSLAAELGRKKIANEPVIIDPDGLPRTRRYYKETVEGIQVSVPPTENDRVTVRDAGGGEKLIEIRTAGLKHDDEVFERTR